MPEWSNGAVSKTVELLVGSGGSNPPLSAERPRRYQRRGLSAERGGWPTKSAWFYPHPDLPRGEGLVASLQIRISAFFSSSSAKPAAGGRGCATEGSKSPQRGGWPAKSAWFYPQPNLPLGEGLVDSLREGSAPVFRQSFLTFPQPFRSPYTTAADSAFLCRCGMAFPPHPCYGLPGRHCLPSPLPQRHQFLHFPAVVERTDVLTFGR